MHKKNELPKNNTNNTRNKIIDLCGPNNSDAKPSNSELVTNTATGNLQNDGSMKYFKNLGIYEFYKLSRQYSLPELSKRLNVSYATIHSHLELLGTHFYELQKLDESKVKEYLGKFYDKKFKDIPMLTIHTLSLSKLHSACLSTASLPSAEKRLKAEANTLEEELKRRGVSYMHFIGLSKEQASKIFLNYYKPIRKIDKEPRWANNPDFLNTIHWTILMPDNVSLAMVAKQLDLSHYALYNYLASNGLSFDQLRQTPMNSADITNNSDCNQTPLKKSPKLTNKRQADTPLLVHNKKKKHDVREFTKVTAPPNIQAIIKPSAKAVVSPNVQVTDSSPIPKSDELPNLSKSIDEIEDLDPLRLKKINKLTPRELHSLMQQEKKDLTRFAKEIKQSPLTIQCNLGKLDTCYKEFLNLDAEGAKEKAGKFYNEVFKKIPTLRLASLPLSTLHKACRLTNCLESAANRLSVRSRTFARELDIRGVAYNILKNITIPKAADIFLNYSKPIMNDQLREALWVKNLEFMKMLRLATSKPPKCLLQDVAIYFDVEYAELTNYLAKTDLSCDDLGPNFLETIPMITSPKNRKTGAKALRKRSLSDVHLQILLNPVVGKVKFANQLGVTTTTLNNYFNKRGTSYKILRGLTSKEANDRYDHYFDSVNTKKANLSNFSPDRCSDQPETLGLSASKVMPPSVDYEVVNNYQANSYSPIKNNSLLMQYNINRDDPAMFVPVFDVETDGSPATVATTVDNSINTEVNAQNILSYDCIIYPDIAESTLNHDNVGIYFDNMNDDVDCNNELFSSSYYHNEQTNYQNDHQLLGMDDNQWLFTKKAQLNTPKTLPVKSQANKNLFDNSRASDLIANIGGSPIFSPCTQNKTFFDTPKDHEFTRPVPEYPT